MNHTPEQPVRILVVEDDLAILTGLSMNLKIEGYEVLQAQDGKAGLAQMTPQGMSMKGEFSVAGKDASWAHPVVAGGRLYLRYERNLYCFDVKAK